MNNADFWASVRSIITAGFTPEGLLKLDSYAEQFISGKLVYQRFSPQEQHGYSAGGTTNVIASLLAGAEAGADPENQGALSDYRSAAFAMRLYLVGAFINASGALQMHLPTASALQMPMNQTP